MKSALVTGVAGFVGSHLAERLSAGGSRVVGLDSFTDYYPKAIKVSNLSRLRGKEGFELVEGDLNTVDLDRVVDGVDCVFHLAAQPGVRSSWGISFGRYVDDNIRATQRLLESCKKAKLKKFVYASSSSIYGDAERLPTPEGTTPMPASPYGATKLVGEQLCRLYQRNFGVPTVVLRYFTVYGPRQRPDMAFNRFIRSVSKGEEIEIYGDGSQARDFTYVDDTTRATVLAADAKDGEVYNVGCGKVVTINEAISLLEDLVGERARITKRRRATGDVKSTSADISRAKKELGYAPLTSIRDGLKRQVEWQLGRRPR